MKYVLSLLLITSIVFNAQSQEVVKKSSENKKVNYQLIFDNNPFSDNLTPAQVKKIKQLHTNVAGEVIKSYTVIIVGTGFKDNPGVTQCTGDTLSKDLKKLFKRVGKGSMITFDDIKAVDKNGAKKTLPNFVFKVVE